MESSIQEITSDDQIEVSVTIVKEAFGTVAKEFNLTKDNCPTHPSFVTFEQLKGLQAKGQCFFGLFDYGQQVGFVAIERADEATCYLEKLAVIPQVRHRGFGRRLVSFALDRAAKQGATIVSIGTIHEHTVLKEWYKRFGFVETGTKRFAHLPFTVCFMDFTLEKRPLLR